MIGRLSHFFLLSDLALTRKRSKSHSRTPNENGIWPLWFNAPVSLLHGVFALVFARNHEFVKCEISRNTSLPLGSVWCRNRCRRAMLGRISKRGNRYLRTLFMQGARVILLGPANWAKHGFGCLAASITRLRGVG